MYASRNGYTDIAKALVAVTDIDVNIQSEVRKVLIGDRC